MPHAGGATPSPCHAIPCLALQIPYFNAPIFLENKTQIGKVEEILGPINNVVCTWQWVGHAPTSQWGSLGRQSMAPVSELVLLRVHGPAAY